MIKIKQIKRIVIILLFLLLFVLIGSIDSMASGELFFKDLNFDAKINSDGSMDVVETWNINIEDTNTLFKTFETDHTKYSAISDVKVIDMTSVIKKEFQKIDELMYHVTKNCYYAMINDDGDFEIAWGVGLDSSSATKTYQISYTVENVIAKYSDYAELYWQFVGEDFAISANTITGNIRLPENAQNLEEIKVWGHTEDLNGTIYAIGLDTIKFQINNYNAERFVEVRALFPTEMITSRTRGENRQILDEVIKEETAWANEANAKRERKKLIKKIAVIVINVILLLISIKFISNIVKKIKELKTKQKIKPSKEIIYYREIPRENTTPSEAVYLHKKIKTSLVNMDIGKIFSATLLDLNLKKIIDFEVTKNGKNQETVKIRLLDKTGNGVIKNKDEKAIFDFLVSAFKGKEEITVKELQKYIQGSSSKILDLQNNIDKGTKIGLEQNNLLDKKEQKRYTELTSSQAAYFFVAIFALVFGIPTIEIFGVYILIGIIPLIILSIINLVVTSIQLSKTNVFTQEGIDESEKWKGLKKYMEEFSMLEKRELPEIVIWENFLVYATAFGIADKVLKQLKVVYPNIEHSIDVNTYSCMYLMMNTDFSKSFSNAISTSMSSAYSSASGGGGGFSGGGGGGRRPEVEEVVDNTTT